MKECPLSGLLPEELFLQNLVDILDRHEPELVVLRNERYWVACERTRYAYMCVYVCVCSFVIERTVSCHSYYGSSRKMPSSSH